MRSADSYTIWETRVKAYLMLTDTLTVTEKHINNVQLCASLNYIQLIIIIIIIIFVMCASSAAVTVSSWLVTTTNITNGLFHRKV